MKYSYICKLFIMLLITLFALSGCSTTVSYGDFSKYEREDMVKAEILPDSTEVYAKRKRLIIVPPDLNNISLAVKSKLDFIVTKSLEKNLRFGGVEIINRDIDKKMFKALRDEIILAEKNGNGHYKGKMISDYAIYGEVTRASYSKKHTPSSSYTKKNGKTVTISAKDKHTVKLSFVLKVYKLPELTSIFPISMEKEYTKTIKVGDQGNSFNLNELFSDTVEKLILKHRVEFQNYFSPVGYVIQRKKLNGNNIFKITAGALVGINKDQKIHIFTQRKEYNQLTGTEINKDYIAAGVVTEMIDDTHSWIYVEDTIQANKIRLGDQSVIVFERSTWEKLINR